MDVDGTGSFNLYELRAALQALGFRLNSRLFTSIAVRFGDEEGRISFDDFLQCIARLKKCFSKSGAIFTKKKNLESIGVCDGMGGQGQYRVGRGSIGCSTQVRFSTSQKISIRSLPFVFQSDTGNSSP